MSDSIDKAIKALEKVQSDLDTHGMGFTSAALHIANMISDLIKLKENT